MAKISFNQKIGQKGEKFALEYIENKGFKVLHTNWRYGKYEIDIIAFHALNNKLHFIEVKTRTNTTYGHPEEYVNQQKIKQMQEVAQAYLLQNAQYVAIQFDIIAITLNSQNLQIESILMIEDIYAY